MPPKPKRKNNKKKKGKGNQAKADPKTGVDPEVALFSQFMKEEGIDKTDDSPSALQGHCDRVDELKTDPGGWHLAKVACGPTGTNAMIDGFYKDFMKNMLIIREHNRCKSASMTGPFHMAFNETCDTWKPTIEESTGKPLKETCSLYQASENEFSKAYMSAIMQNLDDPVMKELLGGMPASAQKAIREMQQPPPS